MRKFLFGFLVVAFCLLSGHAWAAPPCPASPQVYVSSGTQILCIDIATGQVTVLLTDGSSVFGDIAFGPDGLLYFTDTLGNRVFRLDPKITTTTAATLVADIPSGTPTGLSFSSSNGTNNGDLYVNSSTGVWKIAGIASSVSPVAPPITLTSPVISFSPAITAGGNAFDVFSEAPTIPGTPSSEVETLVIVDQTNNQILQSAPPFTSTSTKSLTSVPSAGPGIFANFCGDLLVASGTTIRRLSLSFSLVNGTLTVTVTPSTFVNFGKSNAVRYFEVTADNTVFAATFSNGAGGIVWRVDPDSTTGVPSCSATPSFAQLVSLKTALLAKTPPDLASDIANGVALPPTSISVTQNFSAGTNVVGNYNFGLHKLSVTYKQVLASFSQTFTAVRSRPADISFTGTQFPSNTVPIHFSPFGGFAIQYATSSAGAPVAVTQYAASTPGTHDAIQFKVSYSTQDFLLDPGVGHASGDTLLTSPTTPVAYTDDVTHDFWFADQTDGGATDGFGSAYVAFNEGLNPLNVNAAFSLKNPVASCGTTATPTCNPQFNLGQSVRFAFNLTLNGAFVSNAIARLSITKVQVNPDGTIQILQTIAVSSTNNKNIDNFFSIGNNLYTYDWDSSVAATSAGGPGPGLYLATMFSDSFSPQTVFLTLK